MKNVAAILGKILEIAKDAKTWFRVLVLVITGFAGAILFSKTKKQDCSECQSQLSGVITFLNNMKSEMAIEPDHVKRKAIREPISVSVIVPDTTPINKKRITKIDSLLQKIELLKQKTKT